MKYFVILITSVGSICWFLVGYDLDKDSLIFWLGLGMSCLVLGAISFASVKADGLLNLYFDVKTLELYKRAKELRNEIGVAPTIEVEPAPASKSSSVWIRVIIGLVLIVLSAFLLGLLVSFREEML